MTVGRYGEHRSRGAPENKLMGKPPSRKRTLSLRTWASLSLFLSIFCFLPLIVILTPYAYFQVLDRILPNVQVGNVEVGGLSVHAAEKKIEEYYHGGRMLLITNGIQEVYISPEELGLRVDAEQSAQRALEIGHGPDFPQNFFALLTSMDTKLQVPPVVVLDAQAAFAGVERLNASLSKPAVNASLAFLNGELTTLPGEIGYKINIEETLGRLVLDPSAVMTSGTFQVVLQPVAPALLDSSQAIAEAEAYLQRAMAMKVYDAITDQWIPLPVEREMAAAWLVVEQAGDEVKLGVDEKKLEADLSKLSEKLGENRYLEAALAAPKMAQYIEQGGEMFVVVGHLPTTYEVKKGDTLLKISWRLGFPMWKILEANPGLNPDQLWSGQVLYIPSKDDLLPLEIVPGKRIVLSISKQRLMVYENGKQIKKFVISTGIDRSPTQPGVFQVQTHKANAYASVWDLYMPNFLGIYEAWPGFMNGIHGLPTMSNGTRLWANILGRPASYGCIILDLDDSRFLYKWAENGVVVEIVP